MKAWSAQKPPDGVVNPHPDGHGFLFNDTALEGTVPYHEGMHAVTTPIAGLEGTKGSELNEGQADMWAFTITDNESIGDYVVNAYRLRQEFRNIGRDPDSLGYIRKHAFDKQIFRHRNPDNRGRSLDGRTLRRRDHMSTCGTFAK